MPTRRAEGLREVDLWGHVRAVLLLPVMNTLIVPSGLLWLFRDMHLGQASLTTDTIVTFLSLPLLALGAILVTRAISQFFRRGQGTLAPWNPAQALLTGDVYRFTRNPMKAGLILVLIGESVLLRSAAVSIWTACFVVANVAYIPWFEERGLRRRFGEPYEAYCREVPRWFVPASLRRKRSDSLGQAS